LSELLIKEKENYLKLFSCVLKNMFLVGKNTPFCMMYWCFQCWRFF